MLFQFKTQYGVNIHEAKLPSQSYYVRRTTPQRSYRSRNSCLCGELRRGKRANDVKTGASHTDGITFGFNTDSADKEKVLLPYAYRSRNHCVRNTERSPNLWLLAQLRQPGRQLYADLSKDTFNDFFEELLSTNNFLMKRQIEGETWAAPIWVHCMEYESQLRREAMKLCREQGYSIQAALWAAYRNQEHCMKHWITLLSIANTRCDRTSGKASREVEQLRKQVVQLQKARSRSPRVAKGPGKVLEVLSLYKILQHSLRIRDKGNKSDGGRLR